MRSSLLILASLSIAMMTDSHPAVAAVPRTAIVAVHSPQISPDRDEAAQSTPTPMTGTQHAEHDADDHVARPNGSRWPMILAGIYCVAVVLASLAGGWLPLIVRLTHTRLQVSMSLCGGLMLGIGLLHMLPHSVAALGSLDRAVWWLMAGLLTMFFLIRAFHFHQHEPAEARSADPAHGQDAGEHDHAHIHSHAHHHHHPTQRLSWIGVFLGMGIHTLIDGMALAASVQVDAAHGDTGLLGFGTFLAILLHKPLDTVPISILMRSRQASSRLTHVVNGAFAAFCPAGVAMFFLGFERFSEHQAAIVGCALAFSAGVFLCISLSDLLPELEFHAHDRLKLSLALLIGVAAAYAIGYVEPEHAHGHAATPAHAHD
jgi:zinc and cadmium transporter